MHSFRERNCSSSSFLPGCDTRPGCVSELAERGGKKTGRRTRLLSSSRPVEREDVAPRDAPVRARRRLQPGSIHVAACWKPSKPWAPGVAPVGGGSPAKDGGGERQAAVRGDPAQGRRGVHGVVGTRWRVGLASWVARADAAALFASYSPRHGRASDGARADGARMIAKT